MKKISLFLFLLIILIDDIKSQCSGSACECAESASITDTNPCTILTAQENHKCIAKEDGDADISTYPCKEIEIEKVNDCNGSVCACAKAGETTTCTGLTVEKDYKCVVDTGNTKEGYACLEKKIEKVSDCNGSVCACAKAGEPTTCTDLTVLKDHKCVVNAGNTKAGYACLEKEIEKVSGCNGSVCACAKKSENPTCSELTAQENYKCEDNTDNSKADYACKEIAISTISTSEETKKDYSHSLSLSLMICLIILFLKF